MRGLHCRRMLRECLIRGCSLWEPFNLLAMACLCEDESTARLIAGFVDSSSMTPKNWASLYETPFRVQSRASLENVSKLAQMVSRVMPPQTPDQVRTVCEAVVTAIRKRTVQLSPDVAVPFSKAEASQIAKVYFEALLDSGNTHVRRALWQVMDTDSHDLVRKTCFDENAWAVRLSEEPEIAAH